MMRVAQNSFKSIFFKIPKNHSDTIFFRACVFIMNRTRDIDMSLLSVRPSVCLSVRKSVLESSGARCLVLFQNG